MVATIGLPKGIIIRPLRPSDVSPMKRSGPRNLAALNRLIQVLNPDAPARKSHEVQKLIQAGYTHIMIAFHTRNQRIVGMATLVVSPQLVGGKGWLEDVVVFEKYRGLNIGKFLTLSVIRLAKQLGSIQKLDLTSGNERHGAHALYKSLGWTNRDSQLMRLKPAPADINLDRYDFSTTYDM